MGDRKFPALELAVNEALRKVFGQEEFWNVWGQWAYVTRFGSREYGLATETSDFDYCLEIPKRHASVAKIIRAHLQQILINKELVKRHTCIDAPGKSTLSWVYNGAAKQHASINVSPAGEVTPALAITAFLKCYYSDKPVFRKAAQALAASLREKIHGVVLMAIPGDSVEQSLKSAPFFILCAALKQHEDEDSANAVDSAVASRAADETAKLWRLLAGFSAESYVVRVDTGRNTVCIVARSSEYSRWSADALLVLHTTASGQTTNTARKLSEPFWTWIRQRSFQAIGQQWLPITVSSTDFRFDVGGQTRHLLSNYIQCG